MEMAHCFIELMTYIQSIHILLFSHFERLHFALIESFDCLSHCLIDLLIKESLSHWPIWPLILSKTIIQSGQIQRLGIKKHLPVVAPTCSMQLHIPVLVPTCTSTLVASTYSSMYLLYNWWAKSLFSFSQDCSLLSGSFALEELLIGVHFKKRYINV